MGQGSVGDVWRARHRQHSSTVAVKFLMARRISDAWALEALNNELRTAARIHHPNIVQLLDHDHIDAQTSEESDGLLRPSTPYLVMEWVSGGSLRNARGHLSWDQLHPILCQLLDALATSHARGVIHRDIKPSNILLRGPLDQTPAKVLITDFGISQTLSAAAGQEGFIAGTPAYMAPEQLLGHLFDQGPWTDLFALGCTAWALACGRPPFGTIRELAELTHAQLVLEPPPFRPRHPMPPGLEGWLRRLLSKEISSRYTRAADAAYALRSLRGPLVTATSPECSDDPGDSTQELTRTTPCTQIHDWPSPSPHRSRLGSLWADLSTHCHSPRLPVLRPPISARAPQPVQRRWSPPPEMSPDLIRRRPIPLVGRQEATGHLWSTLRSVLGEGKLRVMVIEGQSGNGCSHLASWLCEEAHRAGVATPLLGLDTPEPGGPAGLLSALGHQLRIQDLSPLEQESRLRAQMRVLARPSDQEIELLLQMLRDPHSSLLHFNSAQSEALYRLCLSLCRNPGPERPLILCLDEGQWALPTIDLLISWLGHQKLRPLSMLVLVVSRTQSRIARPGASRTMARLERHPSVDRLEIGPLDARVQRALFKKVLGLDDALAQDLEEHSHGNPAYAIELVTQWIEEGELLGSPHGLKRRDPLSPIRIRSPEKTWMQRLDDLLSGLDRSNLLCIEIAAALGIGVNMEEWSQACDAAGHFPSPGLRSELTHRGVWSADSPEMVRFSHPMLHACILHIAQTEGRLGAHHLACAEALRNRPLNPEARSRALSRHLLSSGQTRAALPYLRLTARSMLQQADLRGAARQLRSHAAILEICPGAMILEQIESDLLRAKGALIEGRSARARQLLEWSIGSAIGESLAEQETRSRLAMGKLELRAGRPLAAWKQAQQCFSLLDQVQDRELHAEQQILMGQICMLSGRLSRALVHFAEAHSWWAEMTDQRRSNQVFIHMSELALFRGQLDLSTAHLQLATRSESPKQGTLARGRIELLAIQLQARQARTADARARLRRSSDRGCFQDGDLQDESRLLAMLLQVEANELPDLRELSALQDRALARGLGRLRPTLAALELLYRLNQRDESGMERALKTLLEARSQTGLWAPRDQHLVQRMIDTHRTSAAIPLGLVSHLESCLELRPPHHRRSPGLVHSRQSPCGTGTATRSRDALSSPR